MTYWAAVDDTSGPTFYVGIDYVSDQLTPADRKEVRLENRARFREFVDRMNACRVSLPPSCRRWTRKKWQR